MIILNQIKKIMEYYFLGSEPKNQFFPLLLLDSEYKPLCQDEIIIAIAPCISSLSANNKVTASLALLPSQTDLVTPMAQAVIKYVPEAVLLTIDLSLLTYEIKSFVNLWEDLIHLSMKENIKLIAMEKKSNLEEKKQASLQCLFSATYYSCAII